MCTTVDHDPRKRHIILLDAEFKTIKKLYEGIFDWNKPGIDLRPIPYRVHIQCYSDKIYIMDSQRGFFISVYDYNGKPIRTIDNKEIRLSDKDIEIIKKDFEQNKPKRMKNRRLISEYPVMDHFQVNGDRIYVTTHREKEGRHEIVILDLNGKILGRKFLPLRSMHRFRGILRFDPYTVHKGNLYELIKNDSSGIWELHVTDIKD